MDSALASSSKEASRTDALDVIQNGVHLSLTAQAAVVLDSEAVRLILNPCDELEAFGTNVDRHLDIIIVQATGAVEIILDHTADRNRDAKLIKDT